MSFTDRRFHMIGIGGAGVSALATVAYAWGADVSGCDRARTPYLDRLERFGIPISIGHNPDHLDDDMEVVVSGAVSADEAELLAARDRGLRRLHRAELLAEMVLSRRSVCVAGAHGKTTTTAMIAYAAVQLGLDPTFLIGGDVPQLGGNAGPGGGTLLVAEADESDGSLSLLRPRVAVVTNVELDHHSRFASLAEVEALFRSWTAELPASGALIAPESTVLPSPAPLQRFGTGDVEWQVSGVEVGADGTGFWLRTPEATPIHVALAVPGEHNALNAAAAVAALHAAAGVEPAEAAGALVGFAGVGRRFERRGTVAGATVVDDYAHHPTEVAATIKAARSHAPGRVLVCFQPHLLLAHRGAGAQLRHGAGDGRRGCRHGHLPGPRGSGRGGHRAAGRGRPLRAAAGHAAGVAADARARRVVPVRAAARGRPGADGRRGGRAPGRRPAALVTAPSSVTPDYPMSRLTTVGTGGPARYFARPESVDGLRELLDWVAAEDLATAIVGLGSNMLAADEGFDGVVIRLAGDLAKVERDGTLASGRAAGRRWRWWSSGPRAGRWPASSSAAPSPARWAAPCG